MISFFKRLRRNSFFGDRIGRYLLYAAGEIILVVIGILIALEINTRNKAHQDRQKEEAYLIEIQNSLNEDTMQLQSVLEFNKDKMSVINEMMSIFSKELNNRERFEILDRVSAKFTMYRVFEPENTAFNNMVSAESIDLVKDPLVKRGLSKYYAFNYSEGIQERVVQMNRMVIDQHYWKFFSREQIESDLGISTTFPLEDEIEIDQNHEMFSQLYGCTVILALQDSLLTATLEKNKQLDDLISDHLESLK